MELQSNKSKRIPIIVLVIFLVTWVIVVPILTLRSTIKEIIQLDSQTETLYGDISFSGEVIGFHYVKHSGWPPAAIICIKIDSSNVDSFYHFDKYSAFKIENGIATLPIGMSNDKRHGFGAAVDGDPFEKVVYVSVNKDGSRKMLFITDENDTITSQLGYPSDSLKEYDLGICDTCS